MAARSRRRMLKRVAIMAAMILPVGIPSPAMARPQQLIGNGGFEHPDLAGTNGLTFYAPGRIGPWTVSAGSVDVHTKLQWVSAQGAQSLDLSGVSAGTIYQDFATIPRVRYRLTFEMAGNPSDDPLCGRRPIKRGLLTFAGVKERLKFDTTGHSFTDMGWTKMFVSAVAADTTSRLEFQSLTDTYCGLVLDRIVVLATTG